MRCLMSMRKRAHMPRFARPRLKMASLMKMPESIFHNYMNLLDKEKRVTKSEPKIERPAPKRRKARIIKIQWDIEVEKEEVQLQPGEVPAPSGTREGHAYSWTW